VRFAARTLHNACVASSWQSRRWMRGALVRPARPCPLPTRLALATTRHRDPWRAISVSTKRSLSDPRGAEPPCSSRNPFRPTAGGTGDAYCLLVLTTLGPWLEDRYSDPLYCRCAILDDMIRAARPQGSTLELALLGFLAEEPLHGYELRRRVEACFGPLVRASWGSIYPALGRLEQRRLVAAERREGTNLRGLTGSLAGELALAALGSTRGSSKTRRVYRITPLGRNELETMLDQLDPEDDRSFWFAVAFTTRRSIEWRLALLEARQRVLEERRTLLGETTLAGEGYQQVKEGLGYRIDAELEWLRRHIKDLREGAPSGAH